MKTVLAIETSCDETGVAFVQHADDTYTTLASALNSQIDIHAPYGGVFPMLAKREHGHNLVALLAQVIQQTHTDESVSYEKITIENKKIEEALSYLVREQELLDICTKELKSVGNLESILRWKPNIDALVITAGPGLEPALWVGISFVKFLSILWDIPVLPVNHMEGHIASVLLANKAIDFPALTLLISGGHTELVSIAAWGSYSVIGKTRDDAVGEAYDKAARILGLPYPGGPAISKHAQLVRDTGTSTDISKKLAEHSIQLPRPMLHSHDADFSFSGLKTAVLYLVRDLEKKGPLTEEILELICYEFEEAVVEVLQRKLETAYESNRSIQTLIVAGGVIANTYIRSSIESWCITKNIVCLLPRLDLATDNAVMIGLAGVQALARDVKPLSTLDSLGARGGWKIDDVY
jgi:N6-L-threonylcarbamoyladenine synthase